MPTLFEWAGGAEAFRRLIDAFYDRVERDDLLSPFFPGGVHEAHRAHVTAWWVEVFGGPASYTEEHGGYDAMLAHHRGLGITPEQRFRFASLMSLAADDAGLPDDPEWRAAFVGVRRVGDRLALHNSRRRRRRRARPGAALGLGRRAAVPALKWVDVLRPSGQGRGMPKIWFDEEIAATYDDDSTEQFEPAAAAATTDFLAGLAGEGRALELAIGTGRVAVPLAERGVPVSGIEISRAMLERLRAKPGADAIEAVEGDMTTSRVEGDFSLVYLVYNTITNLTTQDEQVACFENAARHLSPGGCFVIEVYLPILRLLPPGERFHVFAEEPGYHAFDEYDRRRVAAPVVAPSAVARGRHLPPVLDRRSATCGRPSST